MASRLVVQNGQRYGRSQHGVEPKRCSLSNQNDLISELLMALKRLNLRPKSFQFKQYLSVFYRLLENSPEGILRHIKISLKTSQPLHEAGQEWLRLLIHLDQLFPHRGMYLVSLIIYLTKISIITPDYLNQSMAYVIDLTSEQILRFQMILVKKMKTNSPKREIIYWILTSFSSYSS